MSASEVISFAGHQQNVLLYHISFTEIYSDQQYQSARPERHKQKQQAPRMHMQNPCGIRVLLHFIENVRWVLIYCPKYPWALHILHLKPSLFAYLYSKGVEIYWGTWAPLTTAWRLLRLSEQRHYPSLKSLVWEESDQSYLHHRSSHTN